MPSLEQARGWYDSADPVHDFDHIQRVYHLALRIGEQEGGDLEIVKAAALLHDSRGSAPGVDGQERRAHHLTSADFAGEVLAREGWPPERIEAVQHCIRAHRFRSTEKPATIEAQVLFDADKLDVLGAIGAARTLAYAALAGQPLYAEPSQRFRDSGEKEAGEPHSSYHEYLFKLRWVKDRLYTRAGREIAHDRHAFLMEFYKRLGEEVRGER